MGLLDGVQSWDDKHEVIVPPDVPPGREPASHVFSPKFMRCMFCDRCDWSYHALNLYACRCCGAGRSAIEATPAEFEHEWRSLLAVFAVWRNSYERSPSSVLTREATGAVIERLAFHGIAYSLDELLALDPATLIDALAPKRMLQLATDALRDPASANWGSRVVDYVPPPASDAELDALFDQAREKLRLEALRDAKEAEMNSITGRMSAAAYTQPTLT